MKHDIGTTLFFILLLAIVTHYTNVRDDRASACMVDMVRAGAEPAKAREACL